MFSTLKSENPLVGVIRLIGFSERHVLEASLTKPQFGKDCLFYIKNKPLNNCVTITVKAKSGFPVTEEIPGILLTPREQK